MCRARSYVWLVTLASIAYDKEMDIMLIGATSMGLKITARGIPPRGTNCKYRLDEPHPTTDVLTYLCVCTTSGPMTSVLLVHDDGEQTHDGI
jgi:hypothetical protein